MPKNWSEFSGTAPYRPKVHPSIDEGPRDPSAPAEPVIVLLHGQPGTAADWYRVIPLLSRDHRVIAVDRPGYDGHPSEATDFSGNVDALFAMLDAQGIERAILVAHSWAGGIAIEAAARAPQRLAGLVLVGSIGGKSALTWLDRLMAFRPVQYIAARVAPFAGTALAAPFFLASGSRLDEEARREARLSLAVWQERRVWLAANREQRVLMRDHDRLVSLVPSLTVPAVVVQGTRDLTLPPKAGTELAESLPDARLIEVAGGHMLSFEEPGLVAAAVRELTSESEANAAS